MKIYLSLPIITTEIDRCKKRAERMKKQLANKGHEVITPFDISAGKKKTYSYFVGKDIEALMLCDAIFLMSGWSESKTCNLEWRCAQIYNKEIFQHLNNIPNGRTKTRNA